MFPDHGKLSDRGVRRDAYRLVEPRGILLLYRDHEAEIENSRTIAIPIDGRPSPKLYSSTSIRHEG